MKKAKRKTTPTPEPVEPERPKLTKAVRKYLMSRTRHEVIMDYDSLQLVRSVAKALAASSPFLNILNAKGRNFPKTGSILRSVFPAGLPK